MTHWILPVITAAIIIYGIIKKTDVFSEFTAGAREGLISCAELLPTLTALIVSVGMVRASGALELLSGTAGEFLSMAGFPKECLPLALIRPLSGSGALAVFEDIIAACGPDSFAGKAASVMLGSTETTFYTVAVYFGAAGIKKTRNTVPAALAGDITGFIISVLAVNLLLR